MKNNVNTTSKASKASKANKVSNANTTSNAAAVRLTKSERLAIVAEKAHTILSDTDKYRYHAAAALRFAVATADAAAIVSALRPAVALATVNIPINGVVALAAIEAEAVPAEVVLACRRADGSLSAAPLLRFMASASVEAERARRAGIKAAERAEAKKAKKADKKASKKAKKSAK